MASLQQKIRFYRDCYLHDFRGVKITNFLSKSSQHHFIPDTKELLDGRFERYPVPTIWGEAVISTLQLDSKEKILYGGSYFVKGKSTMLGKPIKLFAPIYIHELKAEVIDDVYYVSIEDTYINPAFVESVKLIDPELELDFDDFVRAIPTNPIGYGAQVLLQEALMDLMPGWDFDLLDKARLPNFDNSACSKEYKKRMINPQKLVFPYVALGIFRKPVGSRGVVNELSIIADEEKSSRLLDIYFGGASTKIKEPKIRPIYVPTSLSEVQKGVFYSADRHPVTMLIGPPGTGKSYTIAALATDLVQRGESVLIASKNNQAGRVVAHKIEVELGIKKILIKTERLSYKQSLINRLSKLLYGFSNASSHVDIEKLEQKIIKLDQAITRSIAELQVAEENEIYWGKHYFDNKKTFLSELKSKWIRFQKNRKKPVWKINFDIKSAELTKVKLVKKYVKSDFDRRLLKILIARRSDFVRLTEALSATKGNEIEAKFKDIDFKLILEALPAWICNSQDVESILPLDKELFDVLIIDEASQCDIATMIPLMYRAKRIVVVGDPKQLRHSSFLSLTQHERFKEKYTINEDLPNYRSTSLLDLTNKIIASQSQVHFLDEHFRSKSDIISFSNKHFYEGKLKIMRATPFNRRQKNAQLIQLQGVRSKKGVNSMEVDAIVTEICKIIEHEKDFDRKLRSSIGIISPFSDQVRALKAAVRKRIKSTDLRKHEILIGTPYHFQGEERDTMFLSFVIDNNTHHSVLNYLNKEDVFNVSITRARNQQFVYASVDYEKMDSKHLIVQYLQSLESAYVPTIIADEDFESFILEVGNVLLNSGVDDVWQSVNIAGVAVDLAAVKNGKIYCIDLIGFPGAFTRQFTPENIQMLNRMDRPVFFVPYSSWVLEREKVIADIGKFLA